MAKYGSGEAREWALRDLEGACGCLLPTFTNDLRSINEAAIRHDVRREKELGFRAALIVAECGTTPAELTDVIDIVVDEAGEELVTVIQTSGDTLDDDLETVRYAARAGVDLVLPSYPLTFYPTTEKEVFEYTAELTRASDLGVIVFAIHLWNFGRLHPSSFSPALIGRLIDECPNVVGVKNEIGMPGVGGISEVFERFRDRVVVTDPFEMNAPAWIRAYGMRFMGTSNYEYLGDAVPRFLQLLQYDAGYDEGMELYWRMHPARQANATVQTTAMAGTNVVPRLAWKYQGWLNGFNGGPIRSPHARLSDEQMATLRRGLEACGVATPDEPDAAFFTGRNPAESVAGDRSVR